MSQDMNHKNPIENVHKKDRRYKRRTIVVSRSFQFKQAFITLALFGLAAFIVWWEIYQSISEMFKLNLLQDPTLMVLVDQISRVILIKLVIALGLVWMLSILLTHLVAGPLYRLQKGLEALKEGDLTHRIHLRKWDELKNLAQLYNEAVSSLQEKLGIDRIKK